MQGTSQLFGKMDSLARRKSSEQKTKLISMLLDCELVELVQKMWRRYLSPELLDKKENLPVHLVASLQVNAFRISAFGNRDTLQMCSQANSLVCYPNINKHALQLFSVLLGVSYLNLR